MELIISHTSADFDSLAAMAAAKKIYPDARLAFSGSAEAPVREFLTMHGDWLEILSPRDVRLEQVKLLIVVDTREVTRIGEFRELIERPGVEIHVYDHHPTSYRDIVGEKNVIKPVGSTTTILVELIQEKNLSITPHEATLFLTGIYVDTGSLSFPTTTAEDMKAAAWLLEQGANLKIVGDYLNHSLTSEQRELLNALILSAKYCDIQGHRILLAQARLDHYVDEMAVLVHRIIDLERVPAVFSIVCMGDRVYMVGRSTTPLINVAEILAEFGGGGHPTAASASLKEIDVGKIENQLRDVLAKKVHPALTAKDVMHAPVWSIGPKQTIKKAHQDMIRYGYSSYLVMQDGLVLGIISRCDVDKALHHEYGHAPVDAYMSRQVVAVGGETPLSEVQKLMVDHELGRVPVVEHGQVVGVVTRDDIVKSMTGQVFQRPILASTLRIEDWSAVPEFVVDLLKDAGKTASERKVNVFVVGGFVRDLLLGVSNLDLDLVVEGDGIAFASALTEKFGGKVQTHEQFGTAIMVLPQGLKIDVASAREEYYARPAALPEVVGTSIKQDLYRRDFSINAMAIKLNPPDFGQLIDFFGGQRDLQHGIVRILHNLSFVDDPTRVFRGIRFEQRYRFRMESHTEKLLKQAIKSGVLGNLSWDRVTGELTLILAEIDPLPAILRMRGLGILSLIHPGLKVSNKIVAVMEQIPQTLMEFKDLFQEEVVEAWLVYGIALLSELIPLQASEVMEKLRWPGRHKDKFAFLLKEWDGLFRKLGQLNQVSPSEIVNELELISVEGILFLYASARSPRMRERIREYLVHLRKTKFFITGDDLAQLGLKPGPAYKEILAKIKNAQLDGVVHSKEEALQYLKKEDTGR